ncbi:zinc-binding domain-containing protein [Nemania serpens]|nr:zinc-binding domain-containing protein [Nemania serpens]
MDCITCGRSFGSKEALLQHRKNSPAHRKQNSPNQGPNCQSCNKSFSSNDGLQQHLRDSPAHASLFPCDVCNRSFRSDDALQQHKRDSPSHSFECHSCDRAFGSNDALQNHLLTSSAHAHSFSVLDEVSGDIDDVWFEEETNDSISNEHNTHIMGRFRCNTAGCSNGSWGSKKIAIVIRGYPENGYNAVVFNQRCESCNSLGTMTLDEESYVERIAYRLRVWAGVRVERPPFNKRRGPPHIPELCEGCIQGYCQEGEVSFLPTRRPLRPRIM